MPLGITLMVIKYRGRHDDVNGTAILGKGDAAHGGASHWSAPSGSASDMESPPTVMSSLLVVLVDDPYPMLHISPVAPDLSGGHIRQCGLAAT
jgi:hypothetical protein